MNIGKLDVGSYPITTDSAYDGNFFITDDTTGSQSLVVTQATVTISNVNDFNINYADNEVFVTGTLSTTGHGDPYTGNIYVTIQSKDGKYKAEGSNAVKDNKFNVTVSRINGFIVGTYSISISGETTTNYEVESYDDAILTVNQATPEMTVTITDDIKVDQRANVTVILPETATGNVTVTFNNSEYIINLDKKQKVVSLPIAPVGTYTVKINYAGDDNYKAAAEVSKTFTVYNYNATDLQKMMQ